MEYAYIFDNSWFLAVWTNFSILLLMVPSVIGAVLKLIAVIHPSVPTNAIMELVTVLFTKPGSVTGIPVTESLQTLTEGK